MSWEHLSGLQGTPSHHGDFGVLAYSSYSFASKRIWISLLTPFIIHSFHATEPWDLCVSGGRVISLSVGCFVFREPVST